MTSVVIIPWFPMTVTVLGVIYYLAAPRIKKWRSERVEAHLRKVETQ